ncbi:MAG TPA: bifunctional riboflavin kinase/FAD synthetase [Burkholderiales bacterium]|jgi:riboflavin kinase/FMN adenylyltransferase|nr:bifunctional riboflavin kinase/FAD synthetase [Burkholderiales bacterium]
MQVTHGTIQARGGPTRFRCALTIGNFDGVHRGHRAMLDRLVRKSRELKLSCSVLTFEPHPREFFAPAAAPARLSRVREKLELFAEAGVDRAHVLRFGAPLAAMPPERFVDDVLVRGLGVRWLLVGRDFRYGAKRAGDFAALQTAAAPAGFSLEAMPDVLQEGERVSSSAIRSALAQGDLAGAARLLGRPYSMSGRVAHGERLGHRLGFPTANIVLRRRPPLEGVYVVEAELEETHRRLQGVASVGRRPTVRENAAPLLEVHLFDWTEALYGRHLRVTFLRKLRDEEKYDGLEALRAAIARDAGQARDYFRTHG